MEPNSDHVYDLRKFKYSKVVEDHGDIPEDLALDLVTSDVFILGTAAMIPILSEAIASIKMECDGQVELAEVLINFLYDIEESLDSILEVGISDKEVKEAKDKIKTRQQFADIISASF